MNDKDKIGFRKQTNPFCILNKFTKITINNACAARIVGKKTESLTSL